ncbi:MAG: helix-turn-helix domain-containing protein [Pseudonocardiaceae bacterium]
MPDIVPTGQLIRLYRIDRKKSTVNIATHAGITVRYLEMIEAGTKTPSLPVLKKLAKVLGVRVASLVGGAPSEDHEGAVNPRLAHIERALFTYRSISLSDREGPPELSDLASRLSAAWEAWFTSQNKYTDVLNVLPGLIVDAEHAVNAYGRSPEACRLASEVYQLSRPLLKILGRADLGPLVCERVMRYAEETDDPVLIGAATWNLGQAMLADGMHQAALDLSMIGAEKLEKLLPDGTPQHFSVYGGLLQVAAIASTREGDPWRGRELLRDPAHKAALKVGEGHNFHHIVFGPGNVGIHRVSVELENGDISDALRMADGVDIKGIASIGRQTGHLYQVAQCYERRNNDAAVFVHLKMAETICPQDFRHRQNVRNMVATLVKRAKPSYASEVREFAGRIGLLN